MQIVRLKERGTVSIDGADASGLLQGLVTCDIPKTEQEGLSYGALLTPQGKILFDFLLHKRGDGFIADLPKDAVADFMKRMKLYKLRAKMDLAEKTEEVSVFQVLDPESGADGLGSVDPRHAGLGRRLVADADEASSLSAVDSSQPYHARRIALCVPEAPTDVAYGDTFPHDAALDSLNGIAAHKGCYVGQEVVSRMTHRGTARKRVVRVDADGPLPGSGTDVLVGDRVIGALGSVSGSTAIAIVRLDRVRAAESSGTSITCGGATVRVSLPDWATYSWPDSPSSAAE